jgi:hypothetical protein
LVGNPEVKRTLGRRRRRWEGNIKMDLTDVDWIHLAQDRDQRRINVKAVINLGVP